MKSDFTAETFEMLTTLAKAASEVYKESAPAPNVTFSFLKHNSKYYCAVVIWQKGKKKTVCKAEEDSPVNAVRQCAEAFRALGHVKEVTAAHKLVILLDKNEKIFLSFI